jgi:O-antigen ligase
MEDLSVRSMSRNSLGEVWMRAVPHRMPMYKFTSVLFLLSILVDNGTDERKGPFGLTVTLVAMIVMMAIGLLSWRPPRDGVVWACAVLIGTLVWLQVLSGQKPRSAVIIVSVLVFSLVVGGVRPSIASFWYQMRAAFIGPAVAALAFYLGFWTTEWTGRQTFLGLQVNELALLLALGFTIGVALVFHVRKGFRALMLLATLLLLPPIWYTGSRSGLAITVVASSLLLIMRSRHRWRAMFWIGGGLLVGAVMVYAFVVLFPDTLADSVTARRFTTEQMDVADIQRVSLILAGLDAFSERPWLGHGIDAPFSLQWRANHLAYVDSIGQTGMGTHNGFVDFLIMGGVPFCALYLILFSRVGARLWRASGSARGPMRDITALAFCGFLLFMAEVLLGDAFGKLAWWSFGLGLQALALHALSAKEEATSMADGVERGSSVVRSDVAASLALEDADRKEE